MPPASWLMVVTFVTSIPADFILYAPVRDNPDSITGAGADPTVSVALGAVLELILIIANGCATMLDVLASAGGGSGASARGIEPARPDAVTQADYAATSGLRAAPTWLQHYGLGFLPWSPLGTGAWPSPPPERSWLPWT